MGVDFSGTQGKPASFYKLIPRAKCKGYGDILYEQARLSSMFLIQHQMDKRHLSVWSPVLSKSHSMLPSLQTRLRIPY